MKRVSKLLAWVLSLIMVVSVLKITSFEVQALEVGEKFTVSIGCAEGVQAPDNYSVAWEFGIVMNE